MVPQRFELLDALPRTIGGKLDHVALRARPASEATPPRQGAESASALQLALLEIWRRVLGASHVGLHDDFFALGGDSIAALRLVGYVQQELGYPLALRALVASRTVAAIAAHLEQEAAPAAAAPAQRARCRWVRTPITPPTVAAAALSAIPMVEHRALRERLSRARNASERAPVGIFRTPWGEIGLWLVPLLDHELIGAQPAVCTRVRETVSAAVSCGARGVALTGLLASSTDYGRCVGELSGSVALTTGHAATAAAVLLTLRALLRSTGRTLKHERLAVLGVGSIGRAVLELVLQRLPHPEAIVLCDLPSRRERLEVLARQLVARGTRAAIEIVTAGGTPGSSLYSASVILGATSVADVLDIARLRPGTLVVDDSAPHCFSPADAIARMSAQRDIVACEAGSICAPSSIECSVFADEPLGAPALHELDQFFGVDEREIMACTLAALLPQTVPGLAPTLGEPSVESSVAHVEAFARLGIAHATPRLGATPLPEGLLGELAQRYGFTKPGA
jgi:acyl carrier protein